MWFPFFLEIVTVTAVWNPWICNEGCGQQLEKSLSSNPAIQHIELSRGQVVMDWKPNAPFNYQALKRGFQRVGVGLNLTPYQLKVRGTVAILGREIVLTSIGDNTSFRLYSPAPQSNTQYVSRGTLYNRQIEGEMLDQLKLAQKNRQVVEIIGDLYLPETPPYRLIVKNLSFPDDTKN